MDPEQDDLTDPVGKRSLSLDDMDIRHTNGISWYEAPVPPIEHVCFVQTTGWMHVFDKVDRCACGAIRYNSNPWLSKNERSKGEVVTPEEAVEALAEGRQRMMDEMGIKHTDGIEWWEAPIPPKKHVCFVQTTGKTPKGDRVDRCACGALRYDGNGRWIAKNQRRREGKSSDREHAGDDAQLSSETEDRTRQSPSVEIRSTGRFGRMGAVLRGLGKGRNSRPTRTK